MKPWLPTVLIMAIATAGSLQGAELFTQEASIRTNQPARVTTAAIPIQPGKKYQLSFAARADNDIYSVEANPRIREVSLDDRASRLRLEFLGADATPAGVLDVPVISRADQHYVRVFYPPAEARSVQIVIRPGKASDFACKEVCLSTDPSGNEAGVVNVHPSFDHGDLNGYGYDAGYGGRMVTRPDGKTVWNSGFLGQSPQFPVKGGAMYTIVCRGKTYERKGEVLLDCYTNRAARPIKSMRVAIGDKGESTTLMVPADAVSARLRCYYVIMEEVRVAESRE